MPENQSKSETGVKKEPEKQNPLNVTEISKSAITQLGAKLDEFGGGLTEDEQITISTAFALAARGFWTFPGAVVCERGFRIGIGQAAINVERIAGTARPKLSDALADAFCPASTGRFSIEGLEVERSMTGSKSVAAASKSVAAGYRQPGMVGAKSVAAACRAPGFAGAKSVAAAAVCRNPGLMGAKSVAAGDRQPGLVGAKSVAAACRTPGFAGAKSVAAGAVCRNPGLMGAKSVAAACRTPGFAGAKSVAAGAVCRNPGLMGAKSVAAACRQAGLTGAKSVAACRMPGMTWS